MGKRTGFSGLSRFVQDAFKEGNSSHETKLDVRPTKKPKLEASYWVERYNATGLVTHFTDASQVPEHLQKCWCNLLES